MEAAPNTPIKNNIISVFIFIISNDLFIVSGVINAINITTVKAIIKHSLFAGDVTFYIVEGVATCDNFIYSKDYYDSEYYGKINPV